MCVCVCVCVCVFSIMVMKEHVSQCKSVTHWRVFRVSWKKSELCDKEIYKALIQWILAIAPPAKGSLVLTVHVSIYFEKGPS